MSRTFTENATLLTKLGVEFRRAYEYRGEVGAGRKSCDLDLFTSVRLPLTPEEWMSLCMRDGNNYIGGCCGSTSAIQDIIDHLFRFESGWASAENLAEISERMLQHNPEDASFLKPEQWFERLSKAPKTLKKLSPWDKIAAMWALVEKHYTPDVPLATGKHVSKLEDAVATLGSGMYRISLDRIFTKKPTSQDKANRAITLAKLLPALREVHANVRKLNLGFVEGYALIDKEKGPKAIASNGLGLCIFATLKEVENLLKLWRQSDAQFKERDLPPIDKRIGIRKVKVSLEKGVQLLEVVKVP